MFITSLLVILAVVYVVLKTINLRAEFAEKDAERMREELAMQEAMEEAAEEEEMRASAIDVEPETIDNDEPEDVVFEADYPEEEEESVVIDVPEYDTVR